MYNFAKPIIFAEHWKLVAESSSALNAEQSAFSQLEIRQKAGHFKWKAGKRDGAKKREFTPKSGNVDTYAKCSI